MSKSMRSSESPEKTTRAHIKHLLGETTGQIAKSCVYYNRLSYEQSWVRRMIETIEFESDRTLKRKTTIDIDYNAVNRLRAYFSQSGNYCYLPTVEGLSRSPILNMDLTSDGKSKITTARRYENAILGAAKLVGRIIQERPKIYSKPFSIDWVIPFLEWLVETERWQDDLLGDQDRSRTLIDSGQHPHWPSFLPPDILVLVDSVEFMAAYVQYRLSYTLFVVLPCVSHDGIDHERNKGGRSEQFGPILSVTEDKGIGVVKLTRYESVGVEQTNSASSQSGTIFSRRRLSQSSGTEYRITAPLLGRGFKGRHTRIVCPEGMVIDSVGVYLSGDDSPYRIQRFPEGYDSSKYWSIHRGYAYTSGDYLKPHDDKREGALCKRATLELIYNRKRVELHDLGLPLEPVSNSRASHQVWQVRLNISSNRGRFLVPALGLMLCTVYALIVNMLISDSSTISSVSTLSLPLMLGFLVVGEEHLVLSNALAGLRWIVGAATLLSVITACTLSVVLPKWNNIDSAERAIVRLLFLATVLLGISAICLIAHHIYRIQFFRTDAYEGVRFLEDVHRQKLGDRYPDAKISRRHVRRDILSSESASVWDAYHLKCYSQMLPNRVRKPFEYLWGCGGIRVALAELGFTIMILGTLLLLQWACKFV